MTHLDLINTSLALAESKSFRENPYGRRHVQAWRTPRKFEVGFVKMIEGLAAYADAHRDAYKSRIGEDYVLGPPWADSMRNLIDLLNGDLGALDGGTLSTLLLEMLRLEGFGEAA